MMLLRNSFFIPARKQPNILALLPANIYLISPIAFLQKKSKKLPMTPGTCLQHYKVQAISTQSDEKGRYQSTNCS
jgi:hypothetical protein